MRNPLISDLGIAIRNSQLAIRNSQFATQMELRQYWAILQRRWWLPVLLTILTALLSAWQLKPWQTPPVSYNVGVRLLIGVLPLPSSDETAYDPRYYAWLTSEYLVDDFTEVVRSGLFAQNVSKRLAAQNIQLPANVIQGSAVTGKQHRIITLSFNWGDRAQLQQIVDGAIAELRQNVGVYFTQLGSAEAIVNVLDEPVINEVRAGVRSRIEFPLRALLGLLIGLGLLFLWDYLDLSIRNRQELEAMGLAVIGEIPKHR